MIYGWSSAGLLPSWFQLLLMTFVLYLWEHFPTLRPEFRWSGSMRSNTQFLLGVLVFLLATGVCLAPFLTEKTPITGRTRFTSSVLKEDTAKLGRAAVDEITLSSNISFRKHPAHDRITETVRRLVQANQEVLSRTTWTSYLIHATCVNAFSINTGHLFLFAGIVNFSENDDQLASVVGHEMAHVVLDHATERMGLVRFLSWFITVTSTLVFHYLFRADVSLFTCGLVFLNFVVFAEFLIPMYVLWCFRTQEYEADKVGLLLAASSCYDVCQAVRFRWNMEMEEFYSGYELLSTHPAEEKRTAYFEALQSEADHWQQTSWCCGR